jgi:sugar (pentulose or hexulose) kinase
LLPEVQPWGTLIGSINEELAKKLDLTHDVMLAVGANDAVCATLGAGVCSVGMGCLISGSWENILIPTVDPPLASQLINLGASIGQYPCKAGWLIYALNPSGNSVVNCVSKLVNIPIKKAEAILTTQHLGPSSVTAIPHFSGAIIPWKNGSKLRGAFLNLTLASTNVDLLKAVMESIAFDLSYTVDAFKDIGVNLNILRAVGGGSRSEWWTQLKADLMGIAIETIDQKEPGTLGAALLAGFAAKIFDDVENQALNFTNICKSFKPNLQRKILYEKRMNEYKQLINVLKLCS